MRWTQQEYEAYLARRGQSGNSRDRPGAQLQKQQDVDAGKDHNKPGKAKVDEASHPKFRVRVVLRYSDNRRRDIDGALSTVLDCVVRAFRRFRSVDTRNTGESRPMR